VPPNQRAAVMQLIGERSHQDQVYQRVVQVLIEIAIRGIGKSAMLFYVPPSEVPKDVDEEDVGMVKTMIEASSEKNTFALLRKKFLVEDFPGEGQGVGDIIADQLYHEAFKGAARKMNIARYLFQGRYHEAVHRINKIVSAICWGMERVAKLSQKLKSQMSWAAHVGHMAVLFMRRRLNLDLADETTIPSDPRFSDKIVDFASAPGWFKTIIEGVTFADTRLMALKMMSYLSPPSEEFDRGFVRVFTILPTWGPRTAPVVSKTNPLTDDTLAEFKAMEAVIQMKRREGAFGSNTVGGDWDGSELSDRERRFLEVEYEIQGNAIIPTFEGRQCDPETAEIPSSFRKRGRTCEPYGQGRRPKRRALESTRSTEPARNFGLFSTDKGGGKSSTYGRPKGGYDRNQNRRRSDRDRSAGRGRKGSGGKGGGRPPRPFDDDEVIQRRPQQEWYADDNDGDDNGGGQVTLAADADHPSDAELATLDNVPMDSWQYEKGTFVVEKTQPKDQTGADESHADFLGVDLSRIPKWDNKGGILGSITSNLDKKNPEKGFWVPHQNWLHTGKAVWYDARFRWMSGKPEMDPTPSSWPDNVSVDWEKTAKSIRNMHRRARGLRAPLH
ncbi:MAG: hypothetical protein QF619_07085, partial [Candidatus Binatia bacterium]|nr:hypothetical protein [Candidatus Binatia bacterium]